MDQKLFMDEELVTKSTLTGTVERLVIFFSDLLPWVGLGVAMSFLIILYAPHYGRIDSSFSRLQIYLYNRINKSGGGSKNKKEKRPVGVVGAVKEQAFLEHR